MRYANKIALLQQGGNEFISSDVQPTAAPRNSVRSYALQRQTKMVKLILKLALAGVYDSNGTMRSSSGERISVVPFIMHCFKPGKVLSGLDEFINLMSQAGIEPDQVINENVKQMLLRSKSDRVPSPLPSAPAPAPQTPALSIRSAPPAKPRKTRNVSPVKRTLRSANQSIGPSSKKSPLSNWDAGDSDGD